MSLNTFRKGLPLQRCHNCGHKLDTASAQQEKRHRPTPGDATVCLHCGHFMIFADDLTLRAPTDDEVVKWAADPDMVKYQAACAYATARAAVPFHLVPLPPRMRHLDRDPRGYPIFYMAYRDPSGRVHFTVNDDAKRHRCVVEDRCSICGLPLFRARWFLGGPGSAFHARGAYVDPPMHDECVHYALRVCPHLTRPSYDKGMRGRTVARDDHVVLVENKNVGEFRPAVFVAVLAKGQRVHGGMLGTDYIVPRRPFMRVEYWRDGVKLSESDGKRISDEMMASLARELDEESPGAVL